MLQGLREQQERRGCVEQQERGAAGAAGAPGAAGAAGSARKRLAAIQIRREIALAKRAFVQNNAAHSLKSLTALGAFVHTELADASAGLKHMTFLSIFSIRWRKALRRHVRRGHPPAAEPLAQHRSHHISLRGRLSLIL